MFPKANLVSPVEGSRPTVAMAAQSCHGETFGPGGTRKTYDPRESHDAKGERLRRAEVYGEAGQRRGHGHEQDYAYGAGQEGGYRGHGERRSRPPVPGQLVAVNGRNHRGGVPGGGDEDRAYCRPVLGAVVDACQHYEGRYGIHRERERQEEGYGRRRAQTRQEPGDGAEQHPDKAVEQVDGRDRRLEPL